MKYTKKQVYEALEKMGSTNLEVEESLMTNTTRITDLDRDYYWVLKMINKDQYQIVDQGSIWL